MVSVSKGEELAQRLGTSYCENSAKSGDGLREVLVAAVRLATQSNQPNVRGKYRVFQRPKRKSSKALRSGPDPPLLSPPGTDFHKFRIKYQTGRKTSLISSWFSPRREGEGVDRMYCYLVLPPTLYQTNCFFLQWLVFTRNCQSSMFVGFFFFTKCNVLQVTDSNLYLNPSFQDPSLKLQ